MILTYCVSLPVPWPALHQPLIDKARGPFWHLTAAVLDTILPKFVNRPTSSHRLVSIRRPRWSWHVAYFSRRPAHTPPSPDWQCRTSILTFASCTWYNFPKICQQTYLFTLVGVHNETPMIMAYCASLPVPDPTLHQPLIHKAGCPFWHLPVVLHTIFPKSVNRPTSSMRWDADEMPMILAYFISLPVPTWCSHTPPTLDWQGRMSIKTFASCTLYNFPKICQQTYLFT